MDFERKSSSKIVKYLGFLFSFLIFTIFFFFLLKLLGKIPEDWNYFYIFFIALGITLFGKLLEMFLR